MRRTGEHGRSIRKRRAGADGPGPGEKTTDMHAGSLRSTPDLAATAMAEPRLSVFRKTLTSAAPRISPVQYPISTGATAARKTAKFPESAECGHHRAVMKASARGRRVP